jgi:alkylhydroperoxidase family enzyme
MRLSQPRIDPLEPDKWSEEAAKVMAPIVEAGPPLNIFKTLARHPGLMRRWMVFANHVLAKSTLPARERELVILRIGYLCQSGYEWGQHVVIARAAGLVDDEIRRIQVGSADPGWSDLDRALLAATEELHADSFIGDGTWAALTGHLSTEQIMDVIFAVGQYNLVSMALNSLGVQPEDGLPGWDV